VQSSGKDLFSYFWRQNNKFQEILLIFAATHDLFLETPFWVIRSTPLDRLKACTCFAVVQSSGRAKGLKI